MGRISTRDNKNKYQLFREELGLSRERASELLGGITAERIEKIESEKSLPHPDEVLAMSVAYKKPRLCNHYCANVCPIGQEYVPEIKVKDLSQIILEMLASLNSVQRRKERLIEITADGEISDDEIADFVRIQVCHVLTIIKRHVTPYFPDCIILLQLIGIRRLNRVIQPAHLLALTEHSLFASSLESSLSHSCSLFLPFSQITFVSPKTSPNWAFHSPNPCFGELKNPCSI